jgi:methylamine---glutamate N-methyltransferase subunit A
VCGIVGLFTKNPALEPRLGEHVAAMLVEMSGRGPDSAGVAVYRNPAPDDRVKLVLFHPDPAFAWGALAEALAAEFGAPVEVAEVRASHAILLAPRPAERVRAWLEARHPRVRLMSAGRAIEIFKEKGQPRDVAERFALRGIAGSHAVGHTRMATESAVTTEHSHPFSTGMDLCLVHNGSLSNHNRLRERLRREGGVEFQTDNDSEVAAGYLAWRMGQGATLREALEAGLRDLDGFYTFCVGTEDGFAVLRDPIACKHAVLAETDDWVAMSTEYRAIARLPGADRARIWEPAPGQVYSWGRH